MNRLLNLVAATLLLGAGAAFADEPIDINSADAETLAAAISGVGPARARAIVAWREQHGPFHSVDDLVQVQGIGERTLERSREHLYAGPPASEE